jgi:hypothetical protein
MISFEYEIALFDARAICGVINVFPLIADAFLKYSCVLSHEGIAAQSSAYQIIFHSWSSLIIQSVSWIDGRAIVI